MLKYSRQRESIKEFLMNSHDHPTADTVYSAIRIKSVSAVSTGDFSNFSGGGQQGKIAVNRSQADVRKLLADLRINSIGGGVGVAA